MELILGISVFICGGLWLHINRNSPKRKALRKRDKRRKLLGLK